MIIHFTSNIMMKIVIIIINNLMIFSKFYDKKCAKMRFISYDRTNCIQTNRKKEIAVLYK